MGSSLVVHRRAGRLDRPRRPRRCAGRRGCATARRARSPPRAGRTRAPRWPRGKLPARFRHDGAGLGEQRRPAGVGERHHQYVVHRQNAAHVGGVAHHAGGAVTHAGTGRRSRPGIRGGPARPPRRGPPARPTSVSSGSMSASSSISRRLRRASAQVASGARRPATASRSSSSVSRNTSSRPSSAPTRGEAPAVLEEQAPHLGGVARHQQAGALAQRGPLPGGAQQRGEDSALERCEAPVHPSHDVCVARRRSGHGAGGVERVARERRPHLTGALRPGGTREVGPVGAEVSEALEQRVHLARQGAPGLALGQARPRRGVVTGQHCRARRLAHRGRGARDPLHLALGARPRRVPQPAQAGP